MIPNIRTLVNKLIFCSGLCCSVKNMQI